jgi:hypothetical protein
LPNSLGNAAKKAASRSITIVGLVHQPAWQRRDLEHQWARLRSEAFEARHDELARRDRRIEEVRIGTFRVPARRASPHRRPRAGAFTTKEK